MYRIRGGESSTGCEPTSRLIPYRLKVRKPHARRGAGVAPPAAAACGSIELASHQITVVRFDHGFETGVHAEAAQDRADVVAYGFDRDAELVGHLFGGAAACE